MANFEKTVRDPDSTLKDRILKTELPAFVNKCLLYYRDFLATSSTRDIWGRCPEYFLDQQQELKIERNPLYKFLLENTRYVEGNVTSLEEVRLNFSRWLGTNVKSLDNGTFGQVNKEYVVDTVKTCKFCEKEHKKGCCDAYSRTGRTMKKMVRNFALVPSSPRLS